MSTFQPVAEVEVLQQQLGSRSVVLIGVDEPLTRVVGFDAVEWHSRAEVKLFDGVWIGGDTSQTAVFYSRPVVATMLKRFKTGQHHSYPYRLSRAACSLVCDRDADASRHS